MRKRLQKQIFTGFCTAIMLATCISMGPTTNSLALSTGVDVNGVWISNNQGNNTYYWGTYYKDYNFASVMYSNLVSFTNGTFMRVEYGSDGNLHIECYDKDFNQTSRKSMVGELPIFGGFYYDGANFFVAYGQGNVEEDNAKEVIRIVKYDSSWKRLGAYSIYGANTTIPFDAGCLRMDSDGQYLYVLTSHEMYASKNDGLNHQSNLYLKIDKADMVGVIERYGVANSSVGYVSHSFNQFIKVRGDYVYSLNHGDAYPRSAVLMRNSKTSTRTTNIDLISYCGRTGDNRTLAQIGGMELTDSCILTVGKSTRQDGVDTIQNAYITATPFENFTYDGTTFTWLTNEEIGTSYTVKNPQLVKISDSQFLLMINKESSADSELTYTLLDDFGNKIGKMVTLHSSETGIKYALSDCQPVYDAKNNRVVWYVTDNDRARFCSIDLSSMKYSEVTIAQAIHIEEVVVTADSFTVKEGQTMQLGYKMEPANATDMYTFFYWQSNNEACFTIDDNGVLTAKAAGTGYVTLLGYANDDFIFSGQGITVEHESSQALKDTEYTQYSAIRHYKKLTYGNKCAVCGDLDDTVTGEYEEHHWNEGLVTTAPTYTSTGTKTYTCTECGWTKKEVIEKLTQSSTNSQSGDQKWEENQSVEEDKKPSNNNSSISGEANTNGRELIEAFVARMFTKALGRDYDANGLKYWSDRLETHVDDGANVAYGFFNSNEFLKKDMDNATYINILYATFFGREADNAGYSYWNGELNKGMSRNKVLCGFIASNEFKKLCNDAGINRGFTLDDGTVANAGIYNFVERMYTKCLGRDGEENGMNWWTMQIATKEQTAVAAAKNFFGSTEFVKKNLDEEEYIKTLYRTFMDREADASGLSYWKGEMASGMTRDQVLDGFAASNEFKKILEGFGL